MAISTLFMLKSTSFLKQALRTLGLEVKRYQFGIDLSDDLKSLHKSNPFEICFDVGANCGQTAKTLNHLFPEAKIYSVEPASETFKKLQAAVAHIPNITPIRTAVGDKEGEGRLQIMGASVNSSLLTYNKPTGDDRVHDEETVPLKTLTRICEEHSISHIDFLKIDSQGFDLHVMRGAEPLFNAHKIRCLLTEVNDVQMYTGQAWLHEVFSFLGSHGMRFCGIYGVNREKDPYIHWADALFIDPAFSK